MRKIRLILIVAIATISLCAASMSSADNFHRGGHSGGGHWGGGHRDGSRFGVVIGGPFWGSSWYYPYYPYYYPSYYPYYYPYSPYYYPNATVTVPSMPQEYIERTETYEPVTTTSDVWYYCPQSRAYYPYVKKCPGGWQSVPTTPPPASTLPQPAAKIIDKMTLRVNFDVDQAIIRSGDKAILDKMVDFVNKYPNAKIELDGYTDNSGTEAHNQRLSVKRAEAVKNYLIKEAGVDQSRISTVGRGESNPVADNKTAEGRFENRRVEVLIFRE